MIMNIIPSVYDFTKVEDVVQYVKDIISDPDLKQRSAKLIIEEADGIFHAVVVMKYVEDAFVLNPLLSLIASHGHIMVLNMRRYKDCAVIPLVSENPSSRVRFVYYLSVPMLQLVVDDWKPKVKSEIRNYMFRMQKYGIQDVISEPSEFGYFTPYYIINMADAVRDMASALKKYDTSPFGEFYKEYCEKSTGYSLTLSGMMEKCANMILLPSEVSVGLRISDYVGYPPFEYNSSWRGVIPLLELLGRGVIK